MFLCPSCQVKTISGFKKFLLGPVRSIECSHCHSKVSVSYYTIFTLPLFLLSLVVIRLLSINIEFQLALLVIAIVVFVYTEYKYIPLITKPTEPTTAYHVKNIILSTVYIVVTMFIYLKLFR